MPESKKTTHVEQWAQLLGEGKITPEMLAEGLRGTVPPGTVPSTPAPPLSEMIDLGTIGLASGPERPTFGPRGSEALNVELARRGEEFYRGEITEDQYRLAIQQLEEFAGGPPVPAPPQPKLSTSLTPGQAPEGFAGSSVGPGQYAMKPGTASPGISMPLNEALAVLSTREARKRGR